MVHEGEREEPIKFSLLMIRRMVVFLAKISKLGQ